MPLIDIPPPPAYDLDGIKNQNGLLTEEKEKIMKKFLALALALVMVLTLAACSNPSSGEPAADADAKSEGVMTYAEYIAADMDAEVVVETYVQAKQSWWDNKATLYTQDKDGAYFLYNAVCTEEDYAKLVPGAKIRATGYKTEWSGEVEIADATLEILEAPVYTAPALDATALLGTDELVKHQNEFAAFKGMTVEAMDDSGAAFFYSWDGSGQEGTDADLYFKVSKDGESYTFVVEYYLCNETTPVYEAVRNLQVGDTVDIEGFIYWYEGPQPHVTSVTVK